MLRSSYGSSAFIAIIKPTTAARDWGIYICMSRRAAAAVGWSQGNRNAKSK